MTSAYLTEKMAKVKGYCDVQVVFVDIVSYSLRRSKVQVDVVNAFMRCMEKGLTETAKQYIEETQKAEVQLRRDVVVLPSGDGAAIAFPFEGLPDIHLFFAGTLLGIVNKMNDDLECEEFREKGWCNCHPNFLLRTGISEGRTILYRDLNDRINVAGEAVNMAARVMNLADEGQVFLTDKAYERLVDVMPELEVNFRKYRLARIKHDLRIDVYQHIDSSVAGLDVSPRIGLGMADDEADTSDEVAAVEASSQGVDEKGTVTARPSRENDILTELKAIRGRFVAVQPGMFLMGNQMTGQSETSISRTLLVDPYLITQDIYEHLMGRNPSRFVGPRLPVESVSWLEAVAFCNALSELSGLDSTYRVNGKQVTTNLDARGYRLPTEAEWEYCCRGGVVEDRYGVLDEISWYNGNAGGATHDVGLKAPNAFGLFDMLGNVWEWCSDWYQRGYVREPQADPSGPDTGFERVLRGGSWSDLPECVSATFRHRSSPLSRESTQGMRVVLPGQE